MDGHTFVQLSVVANLDSGIFALELQVLWGSGNTCAWEDVAVLADACPREYCHIVLNDGAIANHCIIVDTREWSNLDALANLCTWFDIC